MTVILNERDDFNLRTYQRVTRSGEAVAFGPRAVARMSESRVAFLRMIESDPEMVVYGVTTGFGDKAGRLLSADEGLRFAKEPAPVQSVGVGQGLEPYVVRGLVFARLTNFVSGHAAVSLGTAHRVAAMLDGRDLPLVPRYGQDSFGELTQLYNLFHEVHGEDAELKDINILTNGSPCSAGLSADVALDAQRRSKNATRLFALSTCAADMPHEPYDPAWKGLFDDPFETEVIDALQAIFSRYLPIRTYQAPVSWRILVRVLGVGYRATHNMVDAASIALRSVTDNPVYLMPDETDPHGHTLQSGGFHNALAYQTMGWLNSAWLDVCVLATRHTEQLHQMAVTIDSDAARESRTRYLQISALNACLEAKDQATPVTIPLGGGRGQTDRIMPTFRAYEKSRVVGERLDVCLASLAVVASQIAWLNNRQPPKELKPVLDCIREHAPPDWPAANLGQEITQVVGGLKKNP